MIYYIREQETGAQDFTLYDAEGAYNGTGATVALVLADRHGGQVSTTGKVAWVSAPVGTVRVTLSAGDLVAERGPYAATFVVTVSGLTYAFPQQRPDTWMVWR